MNSLRPELTELPLKLRNLPVDHRGYPVPWFVAWVPDPNGGPDIPDHRIMDARKFPAAIKHRLCWICGQPLGRWLAFTIGPMCAITRINSEPPSHVECAEWSMKNCPFLSNPQAVRRDENLPADVEQPAGNAIMRNPRTMCLWVTRSYEVVRDGQGKPLLTLGDPERVTWSNEGKPASRADVEASVNGGFPTLLAVAKSEGKFAVEALGRQYDIAAALWPKE